MYVRRIQGRTLTFVAPSTVWKNDMVLQDRETKSYWSHHSLRCIAGPLKGEQLEIVPHTETRWGDWHDNWPQSSFIEKSNTWVRGYENVWARYFDDPDMLGQVGAANTDPRLPGKALVTGLDSGSDRVAFVLTQGPKKELPPFVANTRVGKLYVVVAAAPLTRTVATYSPLVDQQMLDFDSIAYENAVLVIKDRQTRTSWNVVTGQALHGPLAGRWLKPIPSITGYWFSWVAHYPNTRIVSPTATMVGR